MKITPEGIARSVDKLGRITIPKNTRARLGIEEGVDYEIVTIEDQQGNVYVGIRVSWEKAE